MTHATKAIYKLLLSDYVKVSKVSVEDMLFDEQDILRSMDKIEVCVSLALFYNSCPPPPRRSKGAWFYFQ